MNEEVLMYKAQSLSLCDKLIHNLEKNKEEAELFFDGEMYKAYVDATDHAIDETKKIMAKIRRT